jgi:ArsR family transcriptional regulator
MAQYRNLPIFIALYIDCCQYRALCYTESRKAKDNEVTDFEMKESSKTIPLSSVSEENACSVPFEQSITAETAETLANIFKALSHPVRVQMLGLISRGNGALCGCDIEQHFDLTQPTISHHLKVLRDAGLIISEARGVWQHHCVNLETLQKVQSLLAAIYT